MIFTYKLRTIYYGIVERYISYLFHKNNNHKYHLIVDSVCYDFTVLLNL